MKKKTLIIPIVVLVVIVLGITKVRRRIKELNETPPPREFPIPVEAKPVKKGALEIKEHYLGTIKPLVFARISTRISGYILKVTKREGDPVEEGELLVEIDPRDILSRISSLKVRLQAAESQLLTKKSIYLRNRKLFKHDAISKEEFEVSKSAFDLAKAYAEDIRQELERERINLSYARITSPFSGVVTRRIMEPGELATPGSPIMELEDPDGGYKILVKIPQDRASSIFPESKAYITLGKEKMITRVHRVYPAVDESMLCEVELRTKSRPFGLPSGSSVGVDLVVKRPKGFIVPISSIAKGKKPRVYAVRRERLHEIPITVLGVSGNLAVVRGNLKEGEPVVVGDPGFLLRLNPGNRVVVRP